MWDMVGGILIGVPLIFFIWWFYFKGLRAIKQNNGHIEYDYKPVVWGLFNRKVVVKEEFNTNAEMLGAYFLFGTLTAIIITMIDLGSLVF